MSIPYQRKEIDRLRVSFKTDSTERRPGVPILKRLVEVGGVGRYTF